MVERAQFLTPGYQVRARYTRMQTTPATGGTRNPVWGYGEAAQAALRSSSSEQIRAKPDVWVEAIERVGVWVMAYKIVGTKEDQTVRSERESLLIAAAKARVWSRQGWDVVVTDSEGKMLDPTGFEKLFETSAPEKKTA
jgi:hypothetical protein